MDIDQKRIEYWKQLGRMHELDDQAKGNIERATDLMLSGARKEGNRLIDLEYDGALTRIAETKYQASKLKDSSDLLRLDLYDEGGLERRANASKTYEYNLGYRNFKPYISHVIVEGKEGPQQAAVGYFGKDALRFIGGQIPVYKQVA